MIYVLLQEWNECPQVKVWSYENLLWLGDNIDKFDMDIETLYIAVKNPLIDINLWSNTQLALGQCDTTDT